MSFLGADDDSTIDTQDITGDEARFVRGEEEIGVGDVTGLAMTPQWRMRLHPIQDFIGHLPDHFG